MNELPWILVAVLVVACVVLYARGRRAGSAATGDTLLTEQGQDGAQSFHSKLLNRTETARQKGGSVCLLVVGLDQYALICDAFGRAEAERQIARTMERLPSLAGKVEQVSRVGDGEIAVLVSGGAGVGSPLAGRLQTQLVEPDADAATGVAHSYSLGIAVFPEHGGAEVLLDHALLAMRSVRAGGGGGFCLYDPQMSVALREQAQLVNDLRKAIQHGELMLYYQPKIDAESLQVTAAEALLRWNHPQRGFVSPAVFVPLAEQHDLMGELGRWVIEEACREADRWREGGLRMRVAVNISGAQMRDDGLVDHILTTLAQRKLPPERFTCEITESVAMEDTQRTRQAFERMRAAHLHVSIDDFGTGYSSLAALRKLPAAELKIDRAFVQDLESSDDARSIAMSIIQMAKALNLRVVAEGVETAGQRDWLVRMGCDELQGFLFSMPVPPDDLSRMASAGILWGGAGFRESLFKPTDLQTLR